MKCSPVSTCFFSGMSDFGTAEMPEPRGLEVGLYETGAT